MASYSKVVPEKPAIDYDPRMVTYEVVYANLSRKPFQPFRVVLSSGEHVEVTRVNQAVAMKRRLMVGTDDDRLKWIWLEEIDRVELIDAQAA